MKKTFILILLVLISIISTSNAFSSSYTWSTVERLIETTASLSEEKINDNFLNLNAGSAILIEQKSGKIRKDLAVIVVKRGKMLPKSPHTH